MANDNPGVGQAAAVPTPQERDAYEWARRIVTGIFGPEPQPPLSRKQAIRFVGDELREYAEFIRRAATPSELREWLLVRAAHLTHDSLNMGCTHADELRAEAKQLEQWAASLAAPPTGTPPPGAD